MTILGMEYDANLFIKFKDPETYYKGVNGVGINDSENKFHTLQEIADVFMDLKNAYQLDQPVGQIFESVTAVGSKAFYYIHYRSRYKEAVDHLTPFIVDLLKQVVDNEFLVISNVTTYDDDSFGDFVSIAFPGHEEIKTFEVPGPEGLYQHSETDISDYEAICKTFYDKLSEPEKKLLEEYKSDARNLMDPFQFANADKEYKELAKKWDLKKRIDDDKDLVSSMSEEVKNEVKTFVSEKEKKLYELYNRFDNSMKNYQKELELGKQDADRYSKKLIEKVSMGEISPSEGRDLVEKYSTDNIHFSNALRSSTDTVNCLQDITDIIKECDEQYSLFRKKGLDTEYKSYYKNLLGKTSSLQEYFFNVLNENHKEAMRGISIDNKGYRKNNFIEEKDYLQEIRDLAESEKRLKEQEQLKKKQEEKERQRRLKEQEREALRKKVAEGKRKREELSRELDKKLNDLLQEFDQYIENEEFDFVKRDLRNQREIFLQEQRQKIDEYLDTKFSIPVYDLEKDKTEEDILKEEILDYTGLGDVKIKQIADEFDISSQRATQILNELVDKGYVTKRVEMRVAYYSSNYNYRKKSGFDSRELLGYQEDQNFKQEYNSFPNIELLCKNIKEKAIAKEEEEKRANEKAEIAAKEEAKKKKSKIIIALVVVIAITVLATLFGVVIPQNSFNDGLAAMENGDFDKAYEKFSGSNSELSKTYKLIIEDVKREKYDYAYGQLEKIPNASHYEYIKAYVDENCGEYIKKSIAEENYYEAQKLLEYCSNFDDADRYSKYLNAVYGAENKYQAFNDLLQLGDFLDSEEKLTKLCNEILNYHESSIEHAIWYLSNIKSLTDEQQKLLNLCNEMLPYQGTYHMNSEKDRNGYVNISVYNDNYKNYDVSFYVTNNELRCRFGKTKDNSYYDVGRVRKGMDRTTEYIFGSTFEREHNDAVNNYQYCCYSQDDNKNWICVVFGIGKKLLFYRRITLMDFSKL